MDIFTELHGRVDALAAVLGGAATASNDALAERMSALDDAGLMTMLSETALAVKALERVRTLATGVVARRSSRDAGHGGFAQKRGHRNTVALVQEIQGASRTEAIKQVRVAEALLDGVLGAQEPASTPVGDAGAGAPDGDGPGTGRDGSGANAPARPLPWHEPIDRALWEGPLSSSQADAIRRGLGAPPLGRPCTAPAEDPAPDMPADAGGATGLSPAEADPPAGEKTAVDREAHDDPNAPADHDARWRELWRVAAEQLVAETTTRTVEDLATAARYLRDLLDPEGAEERYLRRHEARSFRMWTDADGLAHGRFTFDDDGAAWIRSVIDAALRPRTGGPRFVDSEEAERAQRLRDDPRSNDQLTYDLILDTLRAGTTATVQQVFGTRLAGVRYVRIAEPETGHDKIGRPIGVGHLEDGGAAVPAPAVDQAICQSGIVPVDFDSEGDPLDVGRDQRLFTPRQRIALALRDGGCLWPGCDRPASFTEAHHIDPWQDGGRTDIDRGASLCRYHHMNLHHHGWRIRREGKGDFLLHPPDGSPPIVLRSRSPLSRSWDAPPGATRRRRGPSSAVPTPAARPHARSRAPARPHP